MLFELLMAWEAAVAASILLASCRNSGLTKCFKTFSGFGDCWCCCWFLLPVVYYY